MTLRTLNYGNYGIFLIMGNAGFCPSTLSLFLQAYRGVCGVLSGCMRVPKSSRSNYNKHVRGFSNGCIRFREVSLRQGLGFTAYASEMHRTMYPLNPC